MLAAHAGVFAVASTALASAGTGPLLASVYEEVHSRLPAASYPPASRRLDDDCWTRRFHDDFDTLSLFDADTGEGIWHPRYIWGNDIVINQELQYYVDPRVVEHDPFELDDGILDIVARATPSTLDGVPEDRPYVSGLLTTEKSFSQFEGRFDIVAQVPAGQGLWAAFWMLPSFPSWPEGIDILHEIDVMEFLGHEPSVYHTTLHTNENGELESYPAAQRARQPLDRGFHRYSVVWHAETVSWYLDGEPVHSERTPDDYDRPKHLLINLAVGGSWPGNPDGSTRFPARFRIDSVSTYTLAEACRSR